MMKSQSLVMNRKPALSMLLFLFLLFMAGKGYSQSNINYEVHHPSVNSDQFNIEGLIETAISKGQPSVVIPLFELQGKGYNLPISLMFYGGDVNCETEASTIGLGWSLIAGGCITTVVKGKADSLITTFNDAPWQFQSDYLNSMFQIPTQRDVFVENMNMDLMPDEFNYSIPGNHGTLEMFLNGQNQCYQKLYPDESYKLEKTTNGYKITDDYGNKFFFEDCESKLSYSGNSMTVMSSAWFLSRIETVKGGTFQFNYENETLIDLHDESELNYYGRHRTKRITSISSDYGSITFTANGNRADRRTAIISGDTILSKKITKIELKDETGAVVKGYELKNNSYFTNDNQDPRTDMGWSNYRMRLDSIVQYDASGNKLPPYVFTYSYSFYRAKSCYNQYDSSSGYNGKRGSWTETPLTQAVVDLYTTGYPACQLANYNTPQNYLEGISFISDYYDGTVDDYFCLNSVKYPTGALDTFEYESHSYGEIAGNQIQTNYQLKIEGKRLKRKISEDGSGNVQTRTITDYIYRKHDSNYELTQDSSGVLTNPTFHNATLYSWGTVYGGYMGYVANRITSDRPLNSYQGQPVFYTEVEEKVMNNNGNVIKRIIHYMHDVLLEPPLNYVYIRNHTEPNDDYFTVVPNLIYGNRTGYNPSLNDYNYQYFSYIAYPLAEFCPTSQDGGLPHKEVLLDGNDKLIAKKEYAYSSTVNNTRYGYLYIKEVFNTGGGNTPYRSVYNISRSSHISNRSHLTSITETVYSYRDNQCDSVVTETSYNYSLGRIGSVLTNRLTETIQVSNYYPDILDVSAGSNLSPEAQAVAALQQKNIIGKPIQTIKSHNGIAVEGRYNDYKVLSGGMVVPKSSYNLSLNNSNVTGPSMSGGSITINSGFYLQDEALNYDTDFNPTHVASRISPNKVYVWGYDGRYPVAVIENYTETQLNANNQLLSLLSQLEGFRKIGNQSTCATLKSLNMNIRNNLPEGVLIRTYTYDPYSGLTSEFDYSGVGIIYTYDGFGRLSAQYDDHFNLQEDYTYHYKQ